MSTILKQIAAVTAMNVRNIPSRLGTSLVIVVGIAGVVGVLVAILSMAKGFEATLAATGRPDRVVILRGGSLDELASTILRDQAAIVRDTPGIRQGPDGTPLALAELYVLTEVRKKGGEGSNVIVRGTEPRVLELRPQARVVEGRMFSPGTREVIVGRGARDQFEGLEIGNKVEVRDGAWTVVGVFETGGDVHESELWVDVATLQSAARRQAYTTVVAMLDDATEATFDAFKDRLTTNPQLNVKPQREPDYYASRSQGTKNFIYVLGYSIAVIMAIGAFFGALNCMYAAVSSRTVEVGTLRAVGFSAFAVVVSVLIEAALLALLGGVIGAALAYLFFNGYSVSTLNFQTFSQTAFAFQVTPALLQTGLLWALSIGVFGGLFPAIRAARLPIVDALRAR